MATFDARVLVLCKTYPSPSSKYSETSCVAGVTEDGRFIRLFPVPFRLIDDEQQFRKWQWITAKLEKARNDHRPESHRIFVDTLHCDPEPMQAGDKGWPRRMQAIGKARVYDDFADIELARQKEGATLALLRPSRIVKLEIKASKPNDWTPEEKAKLLQWQQQASLLDAVEEQRDVPLLEKIPFEFRYLYECRVNGQVFTYKHKLVDWEAGALFRKLRRKFGPEGWEQPFREKYEHELPNKDLLLMLGNIHQYPDKWLAVSAIYPPRPPDEQHQGKLF